MSDESFIAQFEDGLLPSLAETFNMFSNPNMSRQDLKDLVFRISEVKRKTFFNNLASESASFFASNQEQGRSWVSNGARARETTEQKKEQSRLPHTRTRDGRPKCFNCGKPGHFAAACRSWENKNDKWGKKCFTCGKVGHFAATCKNGKYGKNEKSNRGGNPKA
nr:PREDICTED: cold shock protein 1-like [Tribolium castaneum]|eukprot:XP_015839937.1 PREDICTED: cold shock protein 1-like [Tribolium castaneum]